MTRPSLLLVAVGVVGLACSSTDGPGSVFGTYEMVGYLDGAATRPLPYVQQAATSPADTEEWVGGAVTLASDSTIVTIWDHVFCPNGVCGAVQPDTFRSTFTHYPPGDSAGKVVLIVGSPYAATPEAAVVQGHQLILANFWVYKR